MQSEVWRRKLGRAARRYLAGSAIGAWFGSGVGIAAFGTAISGMVPGAIFGFLSTWLVYHYGKRAMGALLNYLKGVAIRGLDLLGRAAPHAPSGAEARLAVAGGRCPSRQSSAHALVDAAALDQPPGRF